MAEVEVITVRLKYSKTGATAQINAHEFDPEKHARMDESEPSVTPSAPVLPPQPTGESTSEGSGPRGGRRSVTSDG